MFCVIIAAWLLHGSDSLRLQGTENRRSDVANPRLLRKYMKQHCTDAKDVWLFVKDPKHSVTANFQRLLDKSPICAHVVEPSSYVRMNDRSDPDFWEVKVVTVRDYLMEEPDIKTVLVTDLDDVHMNPMTSEELLARFSKQLSDTSRLLLSMEMNCWNGTWNKGPKCTQERAQEIADALLPHFPKLRGFPHSMYMGEREAVLDMLSFALAAKPGVKGFPSTRMGADQDMIQRYAMKHPHKVSIDVDEQVFGNLGRDFHAHDDGAGMKWEYTCLQNGKVKKCHGKRSNESRSVCTQDEGGGTRVIIEWHPIKTIAPFVIHASGQARRVSSRSCQETFADTFTE